MAEVEIGIFKSARQAYGFDDIAIVPSRRTRDPEDVDISWQIDAYKFELPVLGSAMDGAMSPDTAIELGRLGGLGVLNLEGLWTRYEDPMPLFEEIRELDDDKATARMQQMYLEPIKIELVAQRITEMKSAGITPSASVTPGRRGCPRGRGTGQRLHVTCGTGHRRSPGDGDRRRRRRAYAPLGRDRCVRARHRRRRHEPRRRHRQGHCLRRRRRDDRISLDQCRRGARSRIPLGHGDLPPDAAARHARAHAGPRDLERGPARTGA